MPRNTASQAFEAAELSSLKQKMLEWARPSGIFIFLDSNAYERRYGRHECLLAVGCVELLTAGPGDFFRDLQALQERRQDWLFGHFGYDLKNQAEPSLHSRHAPLEAFPEGAFFVPETVLRINAGMQELFVETYRPDPEGLLREILSCAPVDAALPKLRFTQQTSRETYLQKVATIQQHIRAGDCYELNFCTAATAEDVPPANVWKVQNLPNVEPAARQSGATLDPLAAFSALNAASPAPFAACYRFYDDWLLCASPERFLFKEGKALTAQPIKGTARRGANPADDDALKAALRNSPKEQAENVMIVDLLRNDLARSCEAGSIAVAELFGIHTFPQVHQMISTVTGVLRENVSTVEAIRHAFPVGSMTGAPKVKVMELTERYEEAKRGLFSGSVGYFSPDGDFDFNVVIRSLFYNAVGQKLSYQTGGAITHDSDAEAEWEERLLKAAALEAIFR